MTFPYTTPDICHTSLVFSRILQCSLDRVTGYIRWSTSIYIILHIFRSIWKRSTITHFSPDLQGKLKWKRRFIYLHETESSPSSIIPHAPLARYKTQNHTATVDHVWLQSSESTCSLLHRRCNQSRQQVINSVLKWWWKRGWKSLILQCKLDQVFRSATEIVFTSLKANFSSLRIN